MKTRDLLILAGVAGALYAYSRWRAWGDAGYTPPATDTPGVPATTASPVQSIVVGDHVGVPTVGVPSPPRMVS